MKLLFPLLIGILISHPTLAEKPNFHSPVVLRWKQLDALEFKKRTEYLKKLSQIFSELKANQVSRTFLKNTPLLYWVFPNATAEDSYLDVRASGNTCIYAGNISTYPEGAPGQVRCSPTSSIKFCDKTYRCNEGQVPCNPLLFGFAGDNYSNYLSNRRVSKGSSGDYFVKVPEEGMKIIYQRPLCVEEAIDATRACKNLSGDNKNHYYSVGYMLLDFKKFNCQIDTEWDQFATRAQSICDRSSNPRQAELSNQESECSIIRQRAQLLTHEYADTDVGKGLGSDSWKNVQ